MSTPIIDSPASKVAKSAWQTALAAGASAVEIVQALWGQLAGGHRGIAGSPRDRKMSFEDAKAAFLVVAEKIK